MARDGSDDDQPRRVDLRLPARTIGAVFASIVLALAAWKLWPLFLQAFLALLVAVSLAPLVERIERRGMPRRWAVTAIALALLAVIGAFLVLAVPPLIAQVQGLLQSAPQLREHVLASLPSEGLLHDLADKALSGDSLPEAGQLLRKAVAVGGWALGGLAELGIVLTIAVYLLFDGDRAWRWLLPYFPPRHRDRLHETAGEVAEVIFAYVAGQIITSVLCALVSYLALLALGVPAALVLGLLAGVFDILPIIGFFISIVPAVLLGLAVSPTTALIVAVVYVLYNAIENYIIIPWVYGSRMRMSTLTVLLSLFAGALLAGVVGAIAVLPVVASYPIIERIWLAKWLGREVVQKHAEELEREEREDGKKHKS